MKYLITGGSGFLGSNLALEVLLKGEGLYILDNLYRESSYKNLLCYMSILLFERKKLSKNKENME